MRAFRVFVEVCVLRRQPGYEPAPTPVPSDGNSTTDGSKMGTTSGEVSPARTPVVVNRAGGGGGGGGLGGLAAGGAGAGVVATEASDFLGERWVSFFS